MSCSNPFRKETRGNSKEGSSLPALVEKHSRAGFVFHAFRQKKTSSILLFVGSYGKVCITSIGHKLGFDIAIYISYNHTIQSEEKKIESSLG